MSIHEKIKEIESEWLFVAPFNVFFSVDFLEVVEKFPPSGIKPIYVLVYDLGTPVGIIYFQYKYIRLGESLRSTRKGNPSISDKIKSTVSSTINMPTLICGNTMLTGSYGFHFRENIDKDHQLLLVNQATDLVNDFLVEIGYKKGLILIKDIARQHFPTAETQLSDYIQFRVQPEMIVNLEDDCKSKADYFEKMKSKYRVRARRAAKKCYGINIMEFDSHQIAAYKTDIHRLYLNISEQAGFNLFELHPEYFESLKSSLGDKMKFVACFKKDRLVGFFTGINNYGQLDAHFLGYQAEANAEHQLYLNMLYFLIEMGISNRCERVVLSRTALEIKSSVGAVPVDLDLYLKHVSPVINNTVAPILKLLTPEVKWKQRFPFRTNDEEGEKED